MITIISTHIECVIQMLTEYLQYKTSINIGKTKLNTLNELSI